MLVSFSDAVIGSFTTDEKLVNISKKLINIVAFCSIFDSIKGMMKGVIKALGAQSPCVKINLVGHWGINLTL